MLWSPLAQSNSSLVNVQVLWHLADEAAFHSILTEGFQAVFTDFGRPILQESIFRSFGRKPHKLWQKLTNSRLIGIRLDHDFFECFHEFPHSVRMLLGKLCRCRRN